MALVALHGRAGSESPPPPAPSESPLSPLFRSVLVQDHLNAPGGSTGFQVVWGHAASRDLVSWARLPVALWNDRPFDRVNIYTGSATIGVPGLGNVIVYTVRWCVVPRVGGGGDQHPHVWNDPRTEPGPATSRHG